jgi:hypothetical protein
MSSILKKIFKFGRKSASASATDAESEFDGGAMAGKAGFVIHIDDHSSYHTTDILSSLTFDRLQTPPHTHDKKTKKRCHAPVPAPASGPTLNPTQVDDTENIDPSSTYPSSMDASEYGSESLCKTTGSSSSYSTPLATRCIARRTNTHDVNQMAASGPATATAAVSVIDPRSPALYRSPVQKEPVMAQSVSELQHRMDELRRISLQQKR